MRLCSKRAVYSAARGLCKADGENIVIDVSGGDKSSRESSTNDESVIVPRYYTVSPITSNISIPRPLLPPEVTPTVNHWNVITRIATPDGFRVIRLC